MLLPTDIHFILCCVKSFIVIELVTLSCLPAPFDVMRKDVFNPVPAVYVANLATDLTFYTSLFFLFNLHSVT